ncbi:hypothetical protein JSQ81_05315 [Sporosarcina sp. Marseille-Q4063]|uniref:hypothetical protein n=1 Tax=Sporosarcina sp. Marseille-Q4063 TaxID=2810514 RepID=UPI001BAF1270|nr:hypothetical protein [Sporosarcina sp. Marseille-Q4063]QUW22992.1 hypothetical protein JSQ81_05315 [Sporosarcina sp. Marseille-Q4063]
MTTNYKETFDRFSLYFLAILISPILFGVILAIYSMISFQDSWGFGPTVLVVALYSWAFFAFGAFPVSLYLDFSARTKSYPNWVKALLYAGCGGLAGLVGSVVLFDLFPIIFMLIFGMVGGVIHFSVLVLIKKFIK